MKSKSLLNNFLLIISLAIVSSCANSSSADKLLSKIENELNQGKTVIIYKMPNQDKTSEQYADWSANLNDFSSSKANTYRFHKSTTAFDKQLSRHKANLPDSYTVFLKKDKPGYFYEGVIVEMAVYMTVDFAYTGKPLSPMHEAFLPDEIDLEF